MEFNWKPLLLSAELALVTTVLLFLLGIPLAHWLAYSKWKGKVIPEVLVSLPLVLPPTVLGFYLLLLLSPDSAVGGFFSEVLGVDMIFSFPGLVIGSVVYSLPFMVNPLTSGFRQVPVSYREASRVFGKTRIQTLFQVLLPNMRPALLTAGVMTFAHTLGEFGVVLMLGGGIPGKTQVASISIFEQVEMHRYGPAHLQAGILMGFAFTVLLVVYIWNGKNRRTSL